MSRNPAVLSESQCVDLVDLLRKVGLLFLVQDLQTRFGYQAVNYLQVSADAAVHVVGHHSLVRHVVLDDDEAVGPQGFLAAAQELHQVVVCQVACRGQKRGSEDADCIAVTSG